MDMAVNKGIKHKLWVSSVVAYLCLIGKTVAFLRQVQMDGINAGAVVIQRIEMACAVDTRFWRHVQIYQKILEINLLGLQECGNGVVFLTFHMQLHRWQQSFDGLLVNHLVFVLCNDGVGNSGQLFHHLLIAALSIELHNEVAALHPDVGGIGIGLQQQPHFRGMVSGLIVLNADVIYESTDVVGVLRVGFDVKVATHADGEGLVHDAQLEEVGFGKVGTELGFKGMFFREGGCQQDIGGDVAFEKGVMTRDGGFADSLGNISFGSHVAQVHTAVLQLVEGSVGCQTGILR